MSINCRIQSHQMASNIRMSIHKLGIFDKVKSSSANAGVGVGSFQYIPRTNLPLPCQELLPETFSEPIQEPTLSEPIQQVSENVYENVHSQESIPPMQFHNSPRIFQDNQTINSFIIETPYPVNTNTSLSQSYRQDENGRCSPKSLQKHILTSGPSSMSNTNDALAIVYRPYFRYN